MVYAFDTLSYARRLRDAGVPEKQAEAHAEAAREYVMAELVTKTDLIATRADLHNEIGYVRTEIDTLRRELDAKLETLTLRLTVRLGIMLAGSVAILATLQQLL